MQDNTHLLQEQAADRPALQTAFYHNLLKSNFVSRPEMEYMAQRAGIELTDKTYCAAVLRLFPGIDIDAIDGQTVEDAKVLQQAISAYVDELCVRPVHNYKRNTLETLYMFEIQDQENCWACCTALRRGCMSNTMWKPIGALAPPAMT